MENDAYKIAGELAGRLVDELIPCRSGRNSRVYKVVCGNDTFACKIYPSENSDLRDRFSTEINALRFYEANANPYTPRLLAVDISRSVALSEWVEGSLVDRPDVTDIDYAIDFIARTHAAEANGGNIFSWATEPCLCGSALDGHLNLRLERFSSVAHREPELDAFLVNDLLPALKIARNYAHGVDFYTQLSQHKQSLIPADFGFHNAIKTRSGMMCFIDFEYFGWDDPVRLAADFLLHPGMALDEECLSRFKSGIVEIFQSDTEFERRLQHLLPLYGIRWALILLNEFLPEKWQARVFAGETAPWEEIKALQLKKSRVILNRALAYLATV